MTTLLLSGFEPFGDFATNPSWDALELASRRGLFACEVALARIPVAYADAFDAFAEAVAEHSTAAAVSFGVYGSPRDSASFRQANKLGDKTPATLLIETTARNRDGAGKPDNTGVQRGETPIDPDAPPTLASSFPARALCDSLKQAGFEAELSSDAGGYLCNHLFFRALYEFGGGKGEGEAFPYGFVHVPPVDNMGGRLSLDELANAMALLANTLASQLQRK